MPKATRLKKLKLTELSGVDSPANEADGWMVLKSKASDAKELLARVEKNVISLDELLLSDEVGHYLAEAPDDVQKAASLLHEHLDKDIEEVDPEEAADSKVSVMKTIRDMFLGDEEVEKAEEAEIEETDEETPEAEAEESTDEVVEETSEDEESDEEAPEAEETDEPEAEVEKADGTETSDEEETDDEAPTAEAEALAKELGQIVREELDPIRDVLGAALDRIEGLEKASARRQSLDPDVEEIAKGREPTVGDAFRLAAARSGNSVTLN